MKRSSPATQRANPYEKPPSSPQPSFRANTPTPAHLPQQTFEGYVKGGVVHLLEGELPDGIFVKVARK